MAWMRVSLVVFSVANHRIPAGQYEPVLSALGTARCAPGNRKKRAGEEGEEVRVRGPEPPRGCPHMALNHARLPVPPHPRGKRKKDQV